jgi:hypothetical protein
MHQFIITLLITFPLFFGAALLFNYCKKRIRKTSGLSGTCQQDGNGVGCSCSTAVQTMIQAADKIR